MSNDPPSRSHPLKTVRVGGQTVSIFAPTTELWVELNELQRQVGVGKAWPDVLRLPPGSDEPLFASWTLHVLDTVVRHCSDGDFSGAPTDLSRLVREIVKTWDTRYVSPASYLGLVFEVLKHWEKEQLQIGSFIELASKPHPAAGKRATRLGADFTRRALATPVEATELTTTKEMPIPRPGPKKKRGRGNPGLTDADRKKKVKDYADWKASNRSQQEYIRLRGCFAGMDEAKSLTYLDGCRKHWKKANPGK